MDAIDWLFNPVGRYIIAIVCGGIVMVIGWYLGFTPPEGLKNTPWKWIQILVSLAAMLAVAVAIFGSIMPTVPSKPVSAPSPVSTVLPPTVTRISLVNVTPPPIRPPPPTPTPTRTPTPTPTPTPTSTPTPTTVSPCASAPIRIVEPKPNTVFSRKGTVTIRGAFFNPLGEPYAGFRIEAAPSEYPPDTNEVWPILIQKMDMTEQAQDRSLAIWIPDALVLPSGRTLPAALPDGVYTLRLVAIKQNRADVQVMDKACWVRILIEP